MGSEMCIRDSLELGHYLLLGGFECGHIDALVLRGFRLLENLHDSLRGIRQGAAGEGVRAAAPVPGSMGLGIDVEEDIIKCPTSQSASRVQKTFLFRKFITIQAKCWSPPPSS